MASTHSQALHNFILTPQQQNLLFRALTSNQQGGNSSSSNSAMALSPDSLSKSPAQVQKTEPNLASPTGTSNGLQESPYLDYDYDLGPDTSFDFDFGQDGQAKMIGDLPGTSPTDDSKASSPEEESPDKRGHPDDEDEDEDEGGGKRRESEGKVPKKPGRKPLMNEPSSKRKAQNRAAQRAFRERKEKHLKDLETKVEELEKVSTETNNENSQLRAQIDKLTMELNEYKKKLTLLNSPRPVTGSSNPSRNAVFGNAAIQNLNDVNFQFEFPKFGVLPGPQSSYANPIPRTSLYHTSSSGNSPNSQNSPTDKSKDQATPNSTKSRENSDSQSKDASSKSSGSPYDSTFGASVSRTSLDSSHNSVNGANTGSPCSSTANSNMGPSSSCGTSPEPCTQSPMGFKPVDTLTTIGEEQPSLTTDSMNHFNNLSNVDFSSIDWMSQQNGGQFDPQLFGDYREPQDNILSSATFDDSFFNDAFDVDFTTPYNVAPSPNAPNAPKKNLIAEIDARKESDDTILTNNGKLLTCNNIWEKLQACPRVQSGDLDLDGLCSDLQKKAKCGGSGAVVDEQDFKAVMTKYLGVDASGKCTSSITGKVSL
ncbi:PAP1-domain-containing protein [Annulohypoxylon maeteangense]|uniref:PAP1-domain-containing protein n=1 Tax=Annulohypoxylon maeteangense TaxID=1927788 RepID=UPI002007B80B|nr:PAP1-domain-containing protein [Annulohypoxylon maeteangense]KAI0887830.1 PAP1-domain-containing protein [Annulohypoxylon maeteangense]